MENDFVCAVKMDIKKNTSSQSSARPVQKVRETVYRILHCSEDHSASGIQYTNYPQRNNKTECDGRFIIKEPDNMVEESLEDGKTVGIRIRFFPNPAKFFTQGKLSYYHFVSRLELSSPVPCIWVFDLVSCLPNIRYVRFGTGFFHEGIEQGMKKIEKSPSVNELVVNFDKIQFDLQAKTLQSKTKNKLDTILDLAAKYFTGLQIVELVLPQGPTLDLFLSKVPHIKLNGEKIEQYKKGLVIFRTERTRSVHRKPTAPYPKQDVPKKAKTDDEPEKEPSPKSPDIVVSDLSSDEESRQRKQRKPSPFGRCSDQSSKKICKKSKSPSLLDD